MRKVGNVPADVPHQVVWLSTVEDWANPAALAGMGHRVRVGTRGSGPRVSDETRIPPTRTEPLLSFFDATSDEAMRSHLAPFPGSHTLVLDPLASLWSGDPQTRPSTEEVTRMLDSVLVSTFRSVKAALPSLRSQRRGKIVFVSTEEGRMWRPRRALMCAAAQALEAFAEGLHYELSSLGIGVNIVVLGHGARGPEYLAKTVDKLLTQASPRLRTHVAIDETLARIIDELEAKRGCGLRVLGLEEMDAVLRVQT